jgi:hypothetical protein
VLYYLPVTAFGQSVLAARSTKRLAGYAPDKANTIHIRPHETETGNHGSKHGYPASAAAAEPQGTNDQFFAEPGEHVSGPQ